MLEFIKVEWLGKLFKKLEQLYEQKNAEITRINDIFGDPLRLAKYYVEPECRQTDPADPGEATSAMSSPVFEILDNFFERNFQIRDGRSQLFILSDAGMGKTSLLMMLKSMQLTGFWPQEYDCALLKLGRDTLDEIEKIENRRKTILLLDALDEDPLAWGRTEERLLELLEATKHFHCMVLSCRTRFFSEGGLEPFYEPGQMAVGGFRCPVFFLSLFNDARVEAYLNKKFPNSWWNFYPLFDRFDQAVAQRSCAQKILAQTGSLKLLPLWLAHVDNLLESECQDWNAYQVYLVLVEGWLLREQRKLQTLYRERGQENPPDQDALLEVCIRVAEFMRRQGENVCSLSAAQLEKLTLDDPRIAWLKDFDVGGRSLLYLDSEQAFHFIHYTIQDFLLVYGMLEGKLDPSKCSHFTDQMREFLECNRATWLTELDFDTNPTGFVWRDRLRDGGLGPDMVLLPDGIFQMGGTGNDREQPVHQVSLKSFAVSRCAVTFAEYDAFCAATQRKMPKDERWGRARRPVIYVFWDDVLAYCAWLSEQTGAHYTLLTEAQWEYACRAGTKTEYCFGDEEERLEEYAWYGYNSNGQTHPVAQKKANAWGLFDMHGNLWEWVQDWYGPYSSEPQENPVGPETGYSRVSRGGSWFHDVDCCRSPFRNRRGPGPRNPSVGIRLARLVPQLSYPFTLPYVPAHSVFRDSLKDAGPGPEMTALPGGTLRMGENKEVREVTVQRFAIGVYPVTFGEYAVFCAATGKQIPQDEGRDRERRPVTHVAWEDALAYCVWLSEETGVEYRLLSEAEWEYACRAGTETRYYFGNDAKELSEYAWYSENSGGQSHPVGAKKPNAWGLFDMHGNVWEWVEDKIEGSSRVCRGGSWNDAADDCRSAYRSACRLHIASGDCVHNLGFRLARRIS